MDTSGFQREATIHMRSPFWLGVSVDSSRGTRAIAILDDWQCRARAEVISNNTSIFAYTKYSYDGTTGYNEIMSVCRLPDQHSSDYCN